MKTVVIFGGSGFIGQHIIRRIAKIGYRIIIPHQQQTNEAKLRLLGVIGQIIPLRFRSFNETIIQRQLQKANVVINLKTLWDEKKISFLKKQNVKINNVILDPGIGFGKNLKHNLILMSKISLFHSLGFPLMIGTSRKKFINQISEKYDTKEKIGGTLSSVLYTLSQGVQIFRVHNVKEVKQGILIFKKLLLN